MANEFKSQDEMWDEIAVEEEFGETNEDAIYTTDVMNARVLYEQHRHELRYVVEESEWYVFNGVRWIKDNVTSRHRFLVDLYSYWDVKIAECRRDIIGAVKDSPEYKRMISQLKRLMGWRQSCEMVRTINGVFTILMGMEGISCSIQDFDRQNHLVGLLNGVWNSETFEFSAKGNPQDLITKQMACKFDAAAQCPKWLDSLNKIFEGDQELIDYHQELFSTGLVADLCKDAGDMGEGGGGNGKTTVYGCMTRLFGEYGGTFGGAELLTEDKMGREPYRLADLRGLRFVFSSELKAGEVLDAARWKKLRDPEDKFGARGIRKDPISFYPWFVLVLATNNLPEIANLDDGLKRRTRVVHFNYKFSGNEDIDMFLSKHLVPEFSGIFNWLLEGLLRVYDNGGKIKVPEKIKKWTAEYFGEFNHLERFLGERVETVEWDRAKIGSSELYKMWTMWLSMDQDAKKWAEDNKAYSITGFANKLKKRGFRKHMNGSGLMEWIGVRVRTAPANKDESYIENIVELTTRE